MATRLTNAGRDPFAHHGYVNTPVYHASTLLYRNAEDYLAHRGRYQYGRRGTPTSEALQKALADLEGSQCAGVALLPSGLAAVSVAILSVVRAGDHILVTDSVYGPTRKFCDDILPRYGIAATYYDPTIGDGIAALMKPNTRAVFVESPGSLSFEIQDIPAIAAAAHAADAVVLMDNTWASPIYFRASGEGSRHRDPVRHQIYRRALRRHARCRCCQQRSVATPGTRPSTRWAYASGPTTCSSPCADCAPWGSAWRTIMRPA